MGVLQVMWFGFTVILSFGHYILEICMWLYNEQCVVRNGNATSGVVCDFTWNLGLELCGNTWCHCVKNINYLDRQLMIRRRGHWWILNLIH